MFLFTWLMFFILSFKTRIPLDEFYLIKEIISHIKQYYSEHMLHLPEYHYFYSNKMNYFLRNQYFNGTCPYYLDVKEDEQCTGLYWTLSNSDPKLYAHYNLNMHIWKKLMQCSQDRRNLHEIKEYMSHCKNEMPKSMYISREVSKIVPNYFDANFLCRKRVVYEECVPTVSNILLEKTWRSSSNCKCRHEEEEAFSSMAEFNEVVSYNCGTYENKSMNCPKKQKSNLYIIQTRKNLFSSTSHSTLQFRRRLLMQAVYDEDGEDEYMELERKGDNILQTDKDKYDEYDYEEEDEEEDEMPEEEPQEEEDIEYEEEPMLIVKMNGDGDSPQNQRWAEPVQAYRLYKRRRNSRRSRGVFDYNRIPTKKLYSFDSVSEEIIDLSASKCNLPLYYLVCSLFIITLITFIYNT